MIAYHSNISQIVRLKVAQLKGLQNPDTMLRAVALAILPELRKRVHVDGKASDGSPIGTYSPGYMQLRTGNYQSSGRKTKGKDKGGLKNSGTHTRGVNKDSARPSYNRSADTKVILSLTQQMENDLSVMPAGRGYGIGYNNPLNYQKSQWNVETYKKAIWQLSEGENELAIKVAASFVQETLNNSDALPG